MYLRPSVAIALLATSALPTMSTTGLPVGLSQSTALQGRDVPRVPRFPLGRTVDGIPEWERLDPRCRSTRLRDLGPCMRGFVDYGSILGAVFLVDRHGFPRQIQGVGAFEPDTIVQIMSMTKPFISVLVLKLVEQGKIPSVDSRVTELSGFAAFPYPDVTVRQLLTHTSGIWYRKEPQPGVRTGIAPHLTNRLDKEPSTTVRDKPLAFVARHYANPELYPLGSTAREYSNIGFTMLGWIVEELSGKPLDVFTREVILDPLDLRDTFFFPSAATPEQRKRIADLDRRLPDPSDYDHYDKLRPGWRYASPEGGLYSTAEDLRTFLLLFRHQGEIPGRPRVLSAASIARLTRDESVAGHRCNGKQGHSLGFLVTRPGGCVDMPGLSAGTIWHDGRFSTEFWYDPEKDEIGVFLAQVVITNVYTPSIPERDAFKQMLARVRAP